MKSRNGWRPRSSPAALCAALRSSAQLRRVCLVAERFDANSEHLQDGARDLRELAVLVLFPVPVGRQLGEAAEARLALVELGRALPHFPLQLRRFAVRAAYRGGGLQHVVDSRFDFDEIERFADEVFRTGLQRAQLVAGLGGDDEHREVGSASLVLRTLHHDESVHARHLQVEQDEVVAVRAMECADLERIHRRRDVHVAGSCSICVSRATLAS
jgi:hypothetical protein